MQFSNIATAEAASDVFPYKCTEKLNQIGKNDHLGTTHWHENPKYVSQQPLSFPEPGRRAPLRSKMSKVNHLMLRASRLFLLQHHTPFCIDVRLTESSTRDIESLNQLLTGSFIYWPVYLSQSCAYVRTCISIVNF
jgi:hypothetical protein